MQGRPKDCDWIVDCTEVMPKAYEDAIEANRRCT